MTQQRYRWLGLAIALLVILLIAALPRTASAHATLVKAAPQPNEPLGKAPERIELTFNERLEAELFSIVVYDEDGKNVSDRKAQLSQDQKMMTLDLPALGNGRYTVTYRVISADGHPVEGTYVLPVGPGSGGAATSDSLHQHDHSLTAEITGSDALTYLSRIAYYFGLLAVSGWVLWGIWEGLRDSPAIGAYYRGGLLATQRAHVLALLAYVYFHAQELLGEQGIGELWNLFTGTWIGRSWLIALVLSLLGFVLLGRSRKLDAVWLALLLGSKSVNGHAMGNEPVWASLSLDYVHLLAASVWVGGLLLIVPNWRRNKSWIDGFLPCFSSRALVAMVALVLSGIAMTLLYLPGLNYLFYSQWGILLLAKTAVVVIVLVLASFIRTAMKKRKESSLRILARADFGAMAIIVALVGLLTFVSPVPPNEPLRWHKMGDVHMTLQVSPNAPGDNLFRVDVWLPKELGEPKRVQLRVHNLDKPDMAPLDIPLEASVNEEEDASFFADDTYGKFSYKAEGPYLPFAGLWKFEFRLLDKNDDETVYETETRVY